MGALAGKGPDSEREPGILHVPIRVCSEGIAAILTGHLLSGEQGGLGFTSPDRLAVVFGSEQAWILVHLQALHALLTPRGINRVQIDPIAVPASPRPRQGHHRRQAGGLGAVGSRGNVCTYSTS